MTNHLLGELARAGLGQLAIDHVADPLRERLTWPSGGIRSAG